jgi:hypothetical protein
MVWAFIVPESGDRYHSVYFTLALQLKAVVYCIKSSLPHEMPCSGFL